MPPEGRNVVNRRTWYLEQQLGLEKALVRNFLAEFWGACLDLKLLLPARPGYALDATSIRVSLGEGQPDSDDDGRVSADPNEETE